MFGFHRALSLRFPYAIFYRFESAKQLVRVYRVLDLRRDPVWIRGQLGYTVALRVFSWSNNGENISTLAKPYRKMRRQSFST